MHELWMARRRQEAFEWKTQQHLGTVGESGNLIGNLGILLENLGIEGGINATINPN
jgi:hypothetical protein